MLKNRVFEIRTGCSTDYRPQPGAGHELPDVPVLPETLLALELCRHEPSTDLDELTDIILNDLGAVIQVWRAARSECSFIDGSPQRLEDCISALGIETCLATLYRRSAGCAEERGFIQEFWEHARSIAEECRRYSEEEFPNVRSENAYLVGLLHELGCLPGVLGWNKSFEPESDSDVTGLMLTRTWSLPQCVFEYFLERRGMRDTTNWTDLVSRAHAAWNLSDELDAARPPEVAHLVETRLTASL